MNDNMIKTIVDRELSKKIKALEAEAELEVWFAENYPYLEIQRLHYDTTTHSYSVSLADEKKGLFSSVNIPADYVKSMNDAAYLQPVELEEDE